MICLVLFAVAVALWAAALEVWGRRVRTPSLVTRDGRVLHPLVLLYRLKWGAGGLAVGLLVLAGLVSLLG